MSDARPGGRGLRRVLIIPAAGAGTRLQSPLPKVLVPVTGRAMLDHLLDMYGPVVQRTVVVVAPSTRDAVTRHCSRHGRHGVDIAVQERPTGMLDAILVAEGFVRAAAPDEVWITWCDQIAVHPSTVRELARVMEAGACALALPTNTAPHPYIHFERDREGRITTVRQRREADDMPEVGESDAGLFAMDATAYLDGLPEYARRATSGRVTGERNFLPFVPWVSARRRVCTFPCHDPMEAVGINTPEELAAVADYLRNRASPATW